MIFVAVGFIILVISFLVALVSLVREQGKGHLQPVGTQAGELPVQPSIPRTNTSHIHEPPFATLPNPMPQNEQLPIQTQPQPPADATPHFGASVRPPAVDEHDEKFPWEIAKNESPQGFSGAPVASLAANETNLVGEIVLPRSKKVT